MTHIWKIVMSGYLPLLNNLRVISVSHTRDCSYLLRSGWECIQMQSRHLKCEYFPVVRHCRHTNSAPLSIIKSATPPPASVAPSSVVVIISTPMDSSTSSHLSSKPQYLKILVTIMYEFITELCLIVGNAAFQTCNNLVTCALCDDPFLLQVLHQLDPTGFECMYSLEIKVEEYSYPLFLVPVEHRKNMYVPLPGGISGILQKKTTSVGLANSRLSRKWTESINREWLRVSSKRR